jgi:hypothetical protein
MRYYRRYYSDGRCMVICTHCFATLGTAAESTAVHELESQHVCGLSVEPEIDGAALRAYLRFREREKRPDRFLRHIASLKGMHVAGLFAAIVLLAYVLPNLVELAATGWTTPWIVNVLFGDLTGCLCLVLWLKMPRTGVLLYLALTLVEAWLFASGLIAPQALAWVTDAVPTLVIAGRVAQLRSAAGVVARA